MQLAYRSFFLLLLAWMVACAQVGLPPAETFSDKLAAGYSLNAQVRATAAELLKIKKISVADAEQVLAQTDNARAGLDVARELSKFNLEAADAKLTAMRTALLAVQTYLATRKGA